MHSIPTIFSTLELQVGIRPKGSLNADRVSFSQTHGPDASQKLLKRTLTCSNFLSPASRFHPELSKQSNANSPLSLVRAMS